MTSQPFVKQPDEGRAIWHVGALLKFKATGAETNGQFWLAEQLSPAGYASPVHLHTREDEFFIVQEGEMVLRIGDDEHKVGPGATVFAPRGIAHQYRVETEGTRFLVLGTPAGFEEWFFQTGEPATSLELPPPLQGPPDFARLLGALEPLGVQLVGPPPGLGGPAGPPR
ncbi:MULTISPECIES: quercetin 2,3-dioxygenase [Streptomycetaceae]|uniref:quercetin 2,3-dioxygenase n=1 Tax=Streptomycetaceae TaxID=2062 RepID=UPI002E16C5AD|nr:MULTISPECIES: quercetin 2,3-dioxygenase [Streptomycetaceae]MED7951231.1 quercetin 2,3-dioxygenase [Streptomyces sp. BE303]MEE1826418.1 quercetin 2,3-dioxygenase [Streptomyces sp. BE20]